MRHAFIGVVFILAAGAAHAATEPFRSSPPRSVRLLDPSLQPLAQPAEEALPPPPLLPAPGGEVVPPQSRTAPPEQPYDDFGIQPDPYAGTFVGKEVAVGALMVLGADLVSVTVGIGVALAIGVNDPSNGLAAVIFGMLAAGLVDLVLAPLGAALGVYWMAPNQSNNGLFGALLGAYGAQLVFGVLGLGSSLILSAFASAAGPNGSAVYSGINLLVSVIFLALHYVGLPMAASYGIHWGGAVNKPQPRRTELLPTAPHQLYARDNARAAAPIFHLVF